MPIKYTKNIDDIENYIRLGNYKDAYNLCELIINDLKDIKIEDLGTSSTIKFPWLLKAIGGLEDISVPNRIRNDQLILLRIQARLMSSLALFYLNETKLGNDKIDSSINEIKLFKDKLYFDYQNKLNEFIKRIKPEIDEIHLISDLTTQQESSERIKDFELDKYLKMSEEELYQQIGKHIPEEIKNNSKILNGRLVLLESNNIILIPPKAAKTEKELENITFGKKLSNALKKSLYNILCDPKNRIGKSYVTIDSLKKLVSASVISIGITSYPLVAPFAALVVMYGIDTYCEMSKPKKINDT